MKRIAKGNTAEILEWEEDRICKLFYRGYPTDYVEHELTNARAVLQAGIRTPTAHGRIRMDGRDGIIYDKVVGESLAARMRRASEAEWPMLADRFADLHKDWLRHHADNVMDYRDFLKLFAAGEAELIAKIDRLESGNCLLHGDFHPDNIMIDAEDQPIPIDMMNVCKGPAIYDVARTYFLLEANARLQNRYLKRTGYTPTDLAPYLDVIRLIREHEMQNIPHQT